MTTEQASADEAAAAPEPGRTARERQAHNGWRTFGIIVITAAVTLTAGYWAASKWLFPEAFDPVVLNENQQHALDRKVRRLGGGAASPAGQGIEPQPYSEAGASREVAFTERELNALLARNTDLADRLAIDLSRDLVSAVLLVDMDPAFPVLGGRTIRVTGGMELRLAGGRPSAVLRGVSVFGVPLPNAWLGNMKNIDLADEFAQSGGFWQAFRDGIEHIEVREGRLVIRLKE